MVRVHVESPAGAGAPASLLEAAVLETFRSEGIEAGELTLVLLPDDPIRELNRRWLDHDWVPDVLTFPLHEAGDPPMGDVYIGTEQAARQAAEAAVPVEEELVRLAVHGALHLLGHDHPEDPEARAESELYRRQELIVGRMVGRGAR